MLTNDQLNVLRADILTHPELDSARLSGDDTALAFFYNSLATPTFTVWKKLVTLDEIMQNGFDWTQVDNTTIGKARIWEWMFKNSDVAINPSKANIRAGIDEAWKGTTAMLAVRASVYVHCKRPATVLEKLFATGTGSDVDPGQLVVEGLISINEISGAR